MFQETSDLTPHAQKVFAFAADEARRLNNPYVATEHLLLGLIKLGNGIGVNVLRRMGIILDGMRMQVEFVVGSGTDPVTADHIPLTPRVAKVLKLARKEAKAFNQSYVGTEHLLLGLISEGEGVAALLLKALNVDVERARHELLKEIDPLKPPHSSSPPRAPADDDADHFHRGGVAGADTIYNDLRDRFPGRPPTPPVPPGGGNPPNP